MSYAALIPDRRRKHFPLGGGPRPNESHKASGHEGIAAAREVLAAPEQGTLATPRVHVAYTPEQAERARRGLERIRRALEESDDD